MRRMFSEKQIKGLAVNAINEATEAGEAVNIDIANLVDKDGNNRFIEDEISTDEVTGVTFTYAKWSLSGTHLMAVIAGKIDANTTLSALRLGVLLNVPDWIKAKIYPAGENELIIYAKEADMWYDGITPVANKKYIALQQVSASDTRLAISTWGSWSATADVYFRCAFDLLIDNE